MGIKQHLLGTSFILGLFLPVTSLVWAEHPESQLEWLAQSGDANAQYYLGLRYVMPYEEGEDIRYVDKYEALYWLRKSAEKGNIGAQSSLAYYLYNKGNSSPEEQAESQVLYLQAAVQGDVESQFNVAMSFLNSEKYEQAAFWFEKAASAGDIYSQREFAELLLSGKGRSQDIVQAYFWFYVSASRGNDSSVYSLNELQKQLLPQQMENAQRMAREWLAAHPKKD